MVKKILQIILLMIFGLLISDSVVAQDEEAIDEPDAEAEIELTDEEVAELLTRVDRFYIDQDMASLNVDINVYRDPSGRINDRNISEGDPARIAGLGAIVSHFRYEYPEYYSLKIMGQTLAGSEVPEDQTFFSMMLPLPGAPIYTEEIQERFRIRFDKVDEVEGVPAYKIRFYAIDPDNEFFNSISYYIEIEKEVILRIDSSFDNGWYTGIAEGNFFYDEWQGKYLPVYGHGSVLFYPDRRFNIWGKWYRWDWMDEEELAASQAEMAEETIDDAPADESNVEEELPSEEDNVTDDGGSST
jgi:hypothetical protein